MNVLLDSEPLHGYKREKRTNGILIEVIKDNENDRNSTADIQRNKQRTKNKIKTAYCMKYPIERKLN